MVKVVIADNNTLSSSGLKYILRQESNLVIEDANDYQHLTSLLDGEQRALLLMDYLNFHDFELKNLQELIRTYPLLEIMIISADQNKERINSVLEAGVSGFLTKECSKDEVLVAIRALLKGEKFFCGKVYDLIMKNGRRKNTSTTALTAREKEILKLIVKGNSTYKIAEQLFLSHHTINSHRKSILKKLNVKSPTELVIYAIDAGLIEVKL